MRKINSTELYNLKAEHYDRYRPSYPEECIAYLIHMNHLTRDSIVADIGAGTGKFTHSIIKHVRMVNAVEPNTDMRQILERARYNRVKVFNASAENTGIESHSVDMIVAAQSYHWFEPELFKKECQRILRNSSCMIALLWNQIDYQTKMGNDIKQFITKYTNNPKYIMDLKQDDLLVDPFFEHYTKRIFSNDEYVTEKQFIGKYLSKSYAPYNDSDIWGMYVQDLQQIFVNNQKNEAMHISQNTFVYVGTV